MRPLEGFTLGLLLWSTACTELCSRLVFLSNHFTACNVYPLYIPNKHVLFAFKGMRLNGISVLTLGLLLVYSIKPSVNPAFCYVGSDLYFISKLHHRSIYISFGSHEFKHQAIQVSKQVWSHVSKGNVLMQIYIRVSSLAKGFGCNPFPINSWQISLRNFGDSVALSSEHLKFRPLYNYLSIELNNLHATV